MEIGPGRRVSAVVKMFSVDTWGCNRDGSRKCSIKRLISVELRLDDMTGTKSDKVGMCGSNGLRGSSDDIEREEHTYQFPRVTKLPLDMS